jgi:predicted dehydrogenase
MSKDEYSLSADAGAQIEAPQLPYHPQRPKNFNPNIGLIGCGGITAHHLEAYKNSGYNVVALCDVREENARQRQQDFYPDAQVYTNYQDVLDRDDIQVLDIATHPAERVSIVEAALRAGKHVLSQKPFVLDLADGERLADLADTQGVKLAVNQNGRWAPHFSYLRHAVASGIIGDVTSVHIDIHWDHTWIAGKPFEKVYDIVLYDFAIHWFDIVTCFFGAKPWQRVYASNARATGQPVQPPLLGQALVEYEDAQASLVFDANLKFGPQDTTYIGGTKGSILSTGPHLGDQTVTIFTEQGQAQPQLEGSWFPDGFAGAMGELLCAIEENREPQNSARNNLRGLELCFAACQSARDHQPKTPGQVRELPAGNAVTSA